MLKDERISAKGCQAAAAIALLGHKPVLNDKLMRVGEEAHRAGLPTA
jgi:hypothetical protein